MLDKFALRVTNNRQDITTQELDRIKDSLHLEPEDSNISLRQVTNQYFQVQNSNIFPQLEYQLPLV